MSRYFLVTAVILALSGCGPDDSLPPGVPTVPADGGGSDAGLAYYDACYQAGCIPAVCEPLDGGAVRCGVACGTACDVAACTQNRCATPDAGWVDAFCNAVGASFVWTPDGTCDDGNGCTKADRCSAGVCAGVPDVGRTCNDGNGCTKNDACNAAAHCEGTPDVGQTCDDGNVCTRADQCTASATCAGTPVTAGATNRYYNNSNFGYGPASKASWWTGVGYSNQGTIYTSVPNGQTIHECRKTTGSLDHILLINTGGTSYTCDCGDANCDTGLGATTQLPGTIPLRRFNEAAGNQCGGQTPCSYFTTGNAPPGGSEVSTGIFVCPP